MKDKVKHNGFFYIRSEALLIHGEYPPFDRKPDQVGLVLDPQFRREVAAVDLNRPRADHEFLPDLLAG